MLKYFSKIYISGSLLQVHLLCPKNISARQNKQCFFSSFPVRLISKMDLVFAHLGFAKASRVVTSILGLSISFEVYFYNIQLFFNVPFNRKPKNLSSNQGGFNMFRSTGFCHVSQVHFCKALTSFMKPFQQTSIMILMCFH